MLTTIKRKYQEWKDRRFLKRHGCDNWYQYHRNYDPDVHRKCTRIKDFYHGYPYVYCFENHNHEIYYWDLGINGTYTVGKWCDQHCKGKHRMDFHRAINAPATAYQWEINELGGGDYIFAAFKNEQDFNWFLMRWS